MTKKKKFLLEFDEDPIEIGLVRLVKDIPSPQLFFDINRRCTTSFCRIEDLEMEIAGETYSFVQMQYDNEATAQRTKFIANKSIEKIQQMSASLFDEEITVAHLLEKNRDVDYLLVTENAFEDFSVILCADNKIFPIQKILIESDDIIYQYIQHNE